MLRETRKQELKDHIFLTAMQLFTEHGFPHVTVDQITQACGIAKGTFYLYFPKKEAVLLHFGNSQMAAVHTAVQQHAEVVDIKKKLQLLFHDLFVPYARHSELIRHTISEMMRSSLFMEEELPLSEQFQQVLTELLLQAQKEHQLSAELSCADAAGVLVAIYFHCLLQWAASPQRHPQIEALFLPRFELVWQGMNPRKDVEQR
ncbi:TetR/AcrR family transcriptional regulator [Paenibacillus oryzisoli]|uniref:TetR/AcrR family transcriptional regulator n=1 Tax=Paenibacillus oryzisoli TaxID=1850517 RepID=UPI003D291304